MSETGCKGKRYVRTESKKRHQTLILTSVKDLKIFSESTLQNKLGYVGFIMVKSLYFHKQSKNI